jgi:hypothetical protein
MRQRLVVTTDSAGIPQAEVPLTSMWDLVEYLSYQRVSVSYHYRATHFTVSFPRQDARSAQRILDEWATSADIYQPA